MLIVPMCQCAFRSLAIQVYWGPGEGGRLLFIKGDQGGVYTDMGYPGSGHVGQIWEPQI